MGLGQDDPKGKLGHSSKARGTDTEDSYLLPSSPQGGGVPKMGQEGEHTDR